MFGTVKEISAELFREYGADEPLAVLIWDSEAVRYFAQEYHPTAADELAVLESIGCMEIDEYQLLGVDAVMVKQIMLSATTTRRETQSVTVNKQELERLLHFAANQLDSNNAEEMTAEEREAMQTIDALLNQL
ncbi:DUF1380 family protein [Serratia marcescens]|uniref:DUF1380 family protein n=1 Tax=Serratia marcescens TaxID=615 RepID=UPI00092880F2|nr:DUF1380 family protein [Serratia marcescens]OJH81857.1 hypothetical protein ASJ78_04752 [Serratia marcescens]